MTFIISVCKCLIFLNIIVVKRGARCERNVANAKRGTDLKRLYRVEGAYIFFVLRCISCKKIKNVFYRTNVRLLLLFWDIFWKPPVQALETCGGQHRFHDQHRVAPILILSLTPSPTVAWQRAVVRGNRVVLFRAHGKRTFAGRVLWRDNGYLVVFSPSKTAAISFGRLFVGYCSLTTGRAAKEIYRIDRTVRKVSSPAVLVPQKPGSPLFDTFVVFNRPRPCSFRAPRDFLGGATSYFWIPLSLPRHTRTPARISGRSINCPACVYR
jgi:hypothetical protein